jgi:DNA-binding NarL/FixJ family response regulator
MDNKIRILLVDDHQIFREGIELMFSDVDDIEVVDVSSDGENALKKIRLHKPDIVVLDISMPEKSGLEVLATLEEQQLQTKVLVLSMHIKEDYILKAMKDGVKGYLPKQETTKNELIKAIKTIHEGQDYFHHSVEEVITKYFINKAKQKETPAEKDYNSLTKREKEVLNLVVEGLTNQEISEKLFVNIRTVETHKTNILQKLQLKNSVELVKFAIKNKLVDL